MGKGDLDAAAAAGWDEELLSIISALDRASGDTDPSGIDTDEECSEQYPVIWAMQQLCKMREALSAHAHASDCDKQGER